VTSPATALRTGGAMLVAGLVLAVAGCGGDEPSPTTKWAGDLCTAVSTWRSDIADTAEALNTAPTRAGLRQAADDARATTQTLIETVRGLGRPPDTQAGSQARATLETLSSELDADVAAIRGAVEDVTDVQSALAAVSSVSASVTEISSQISTTLGELASLRDVDDQLRQAFSDADACDGVIPSGS
jgi:hypothetical protein